MTADSAGVITCPACYRVSHHPDDVTNGYCGACHAYTQPALFTAPEAPPAEPKPAAPKSVAFGVCPNHPYQLRLTGLVRQGRHLYWRAHTVPAALSTRPRWCTASDAPLHAVPAVQHAHQPLPTCPCGGARHDIEETEQEQQ